MFRLVAAAEKVDLYDDFTGILVVDGIQKTVWVTVTIPFTDYRTRLAV